MEREEAIDRRPGHRHGSVLGNGSLLAEGSVLDEGNLLGDAGPGGPPDAKPGSGKAVRSTSATGPGAQVLSLDTLVRLKRGQTASRALRRLPVPEGMTVPLGCDAVAVPARFGPLLMTRLPRVGCVYADGAHWWWLVPSESDVALDWPAPARYAAGAVVPDTPHAPGLIHKPAGTLPYTPPIPLYLAVCRVTGTTPVWSRPISA